MGRVRGLKAETGRAAVWIGVGALSACFFFGSPRPAPADSITGRADLIYSRSNFVSQDAAGNQENTDSRSFNELYSLTADKSLLPNLRLYANGIFQQNASDSITNGERTSSTTVLTRPYLDLTLRSSPFSGGVSYSKVTIETRTPGSPRIPLINEVYNGSLGWKPSELPSLDVRIVQAKNYDRDRAMINTENSSVTVNSDYSPIKPVHVRYHGNYIDQRDLLAGNESTTTGQAGRIDYGDQFFHNRLSLTASEDSAFSTTRTSTATGQGTFNMQVFAIQGLSLNTFDVQGLSRVQLADAAFLIDNVLNGPRTDSNNIGASLFPQDTTPRNIGLQFAVPSEVNTVDVWVYSVHDTRNPDTTQDFLTPAVAGAFTWAVYTSSDKITWSLYQSGAPAQYTPFAAQLGVGKFEITFPNVTSKYLKVVVTPLVPSAAGAEGLSFPGVYLTELQALISTATAKIQGQHSAKTQTTNVAAKYTILDKPFLSYDFSYFAVQSESFLSTSRNSTMSNGLSYSQIYNAVFSGSAGAQRIDSNGSEPNSRRVVYQFSASGMAAPLPALHHTLSYGYQDQTSSEGDSSSQSVYLTNAAALYQGVDAYLNGGETWAVDVNHARSTSYQYAYGLSLAPLKILTISASSTYSKSVSVTSVYYSRSDTLSVAYSPFPTMFMNASRTTLDESTHHDRLQSYAFSWAPFPGADLVFGFTYLETLQLQNTVVEKTIQEFVRWNINRKMYAQTSYANSVETSDIQRTLVRTFSALLSVAI